MIHKTAIIDSNTKISKNVIIGPFSVIGSNVEIGENTEIQSHVNITGNTIIGKNNKIFPFASIGNSPQDLKFQGEETKSLLDVNFPLSSGVAPGQGMYLQSSTLATANRISPYCYGIESNYFSFAGTSIMPSNPLGWASIASNLAPYLGKYVKINF